MAAEADEKRMKLRYDGACRVCGVFLPARSEAIYERATKTVRCVDCAESEESEPTADDPAAQPDPGVAGASARREHERRKARDEERLRAKWGRLGGIAVALSEERQSTRVWQQGAIGEELLGARLEGLVSEGVAVLHDRRIPGTRANIDYLVVTTGGVWVVDAKRYKGRRPELSVEGGILRPRVEKLLVGRRDQSKLVDGLLKQMALVGEQVDVPVFGSLCFIEADWPLIGGSIVTRGVHVVWPKRLVKLIMESSAGTVDVAATCRRLATSFPAA